MGKAQFLQKKKKKLHKKAYGEMVRLFDLSAESFPAKESINYAKHAYAFAKRHRISVPKQYKASFCKKCYTPLFAGKTLRVRFSAGKAPKKILTCLNCSYVKRIVLK